jgi:apolipoprotein N-acyltransferase
MSCVIWVALGPWIWLLGRDSPWTGPLVAGAGAASVCLVRLAWLPGVLADAFWVERTYALGLWLSAGLAFGAVFVPFGAWVRGLSPRRVFFAPAVGLAYGVAEWTAATMWPRVPWVVVGGTQIDTPVAALASSTGVHGVSAVVVAVNALWVQWALGAGPRTCLSGAGVVAILVAGATLVSRTGETHARDISLALIQPGLPMKERGRADFHPRQTARLLALGSQLRDAELVLWPESSLAPGAETRVQEWVAEREVELLATRQGSVWHFAPGRKPHKIYDKRALLPLAEQVPGRLPSWLRRRLGRLVPATPLVPGKAPARRVGAAIDVLLCWEAAFSRVGPVRASLIVNPVNDGWYDHTRGAAQHLRLARWRAVERAATVARVASTGITALVAPDGRVLEQLAVGRSGTLEARVPLAPRVTPFERAGYTPLVVLALVASASARRTRSDRDESRRRCRRR